MTTIGLLTLLLGSRLRGPGGIGHRWRDRLAHAAGRRPLDPRAYERATALEIALGVVQILYGILAIVILSMNGPEFTQAQA